MTTIDTGSLAEQVREFAGTLPKPALLRLADTLGVPAAPRKRMDTSVIAAAVLRPESASRIADALPADARRLLLVAAAIGGRGDVWTMRDALVRRRDWDHARFDGAMAELAAAGLAFRDAHWNYSILPGISTPLLPRAFTAIADLQPEDPTPPRFAFLLAVLAAYCVESPPLIKQDGSIYVKWTEKAAERLAHPAALRGRFDNALVFLVRLGVLRETEQAERRVLRFSRSGAAAAFAGAPTDLPLTVLADNTNERRLARVALATLERIWTSVEAPSQDDLIVRSAELPRLGRISGSSIGPEDVDPVQLAQGVAFLRYLGLVDVTHAGGCAQLRRPAPATDAARWIVQPNFEVLVPEDVRAGEIARLGLVAEVVRLDRVATFSITRQAVERGAVLAGREFDPIAILASSSAAPVPENVAATIRGWNRVVAPMRPYVGAFIVAETPEQEAFLRTHEHCRDEPAPKVFVFAAEDLQRLLTQAGKAGHPSKPTRRISKWADSGGETLDDDAPATGRVLVAETSKKVAAEIAAWVAAKLPETKAPAKAPPPAVPAPPTRAHVGASSLPTLGNVTTSAISAFAQKYSRVYRALARHPQLLAIAMQSSEGFLRRLNRDGDPDLIVEAMTMVLREALVADTEVSPDHDGPHGPGCDCDEDADGDGPLGDLAAALRRRLAQGGPRPKQLPPEPSAPPPPPARAAARSDTPWVTPAPGELHSLLLHAVEERTWVEILYLNSAQQQKARVVLPVVLRDGDRPSVQATIRESGAKADFLLDRISAFRRLD